MSKNLLYTTIIILSCLGTVNAVYYSAPRTLTMVFRNGTDIYTIINWQKDLHLEGQASVIYKLKIVTQTVTPTSCIVVIGTKVLDAPIMDAGNYFLVSFPEKAELMQCSGIAEMNETYVGKEVVLDVFVTINTATFYSLRQIISITIAHDEWKRVNWTQILPSPAELMPSCEVRCSQVYATMYVSRGAITSSGKIVLPETSFKAMGFLKPCLGEIPILSINELRTITYNFVTSFTPIFKPLENANSETSSIPIVSLMIIMSYSIWRLKGRRKIITYVSHERNG